jgi:hypothetical protein
MRRRPRYAGELVTIFDLATRSSQDMRRQTGIVQDKA